MEMKITKVTKTYFETEGERVYFFEPLDEEMTVSELQELMNENEKFLLGEIQKMKKEQITEGSVIDKSRKIKNGGVMEIDTIEKKIRFEVVSACASVWKNTINDLSAKGSIENGANGAIRNITEALTEKYLLKVEEIAEIIHKGIYDKDISEEFPVRNLHIYAIAKIICDTQRNKKI
jgi:hypothetical protein